MDKLGVITAFLYYIVVYNIPLLYGTVGEIVVELIWLIMEEPILT